jgi:geranylgeranyl reductase family protein
MLKDSLKDIVIVGGGPAGSFCAYNLAKNGIYPIIFDDSHPREKPCGGGISSFALKKFPILHGVPKSKYYGNKIKLISPSGNEVDTYGETGMNISRLHLDKYLLEKATKAGSILAREKVIAIEKNKDYWTVKTKKRKIKARFIIGADGVNSLIRKNVLGVIPKENLGLCFGYFVKGRKPMLIKFVENIPGFIWSFPREDHTSIGIGSDLIHGNYLKKILNNFISSYFKEFKVISEWSAIIPTIKNSNFYKLPCTGKNWGLIGDAAGHVDSITGEGIMYALWDGELLSEAIKKDDITLFDKLWRNEYGYDLIEGSKLRKYIYNPYAIEISINLASKSKTYARILHDMIGSEIEYKALFWRTLRQLPKILFDMISK